MGPLVTICARGGSQGVRKKNIRPVAGKPLIAYTIECALAWGRGSRVVVSTESEEIAEVARQWGAEVPFVRPDELARGEVPKMAVIRHALHEVERQTGEHYEVIVDLDATAPLRHVANVEEAYQLFLSRRPLTVFSVVHARRNPYYNVVEEDAEGYVHLSKNFDIDITCRQMAPIVYDMNASVHIYDRQYLVEETNWHVCSPRSLPYVMEDISSVDIDSETDLMYVEYLLEQGVFVP